MQSAVQLFFRTIGIEILTHLFKFALDALNKRKVEIKKESESGETSENQ